MKYQSVINTRDIPMMVLLGWTWFLVWTWNHRHQLIQRAVDDSIKVMELGARARCAWQDAIDYVEQPGVLVEQGQALTPANFVLCQANRLFTVVWQTVESVAVNFTYGLDHIKQQLH